MQLTMANTVLSDVMLAVHGRGSVARADSTCADAVSSLEFVLAPMLAPVLTLVSSMILLVRSMRIPGKLSCRCSPSRELGPGLNHAHWRRQGLRSISSDATFVAFMERSWSLVRTLRSGPVVTSPSQVQCPSQHSPVQGAAAGWTTAVVA